MQNCAIHATFERNKPAKADLDRFRCFRGKTRVISVSYTHLTLPTTPYV